MRNDESKRDPLTYAIIGAAMRVRMKLGCRLLESAYHAFLCRAFETDGLSFVSEAECSAEFEGLKVDKAFRCDLIVEGLVIVEVKAVPDILPIHRAQLLTYMRLSGIGKGLLINFNAIPFTSGIVRMVLSEPEIPGTTGTTGKAIETQMTQMARR